MNLDDISALFYQAGINYSLAIQPYALDLLWGLVIIEIISSLVMFFVEGQLDPWHHGGRLVRQVFVSWFCYYVIVDGFTIFIGVIHSFAIIGQKVSNIPNLSPQGVVLIGLQIAASIMNSPGTSGIISNIELGVVEAICVVVIFGAFLLVAIELVLLLARTYITVGLGVILVAFGANRFTSSLSEGYFANVVRIGVKLLFFYAVLSVGVTIVNQLEAAILANCNPVPATVGLLGSYYVPPAAITTTVCSGALSTRDLLGFVAMAATFACVVVFVPEYASELVGGSISLGLARAIEATMIARTVSRPITSAIGGLARTLGGDAGGNENRTGGGDSPAVQAAMASRATKAANNQTASAGTAPLSPFNGQPPGYNYRPPSGPQLPPPHDGSGGSGAALEYQPGRPGNYTRDMAVDVTDLQNGNGKDKNPA
jgi:P-type conjugative transfer protein TrbL